MSLPIPKRIVVTDYSGEPLLSLQGGGSLAVHVVLDAVTPTDLYIALDANNINVSVPGRVTIAAGDYRGFVLCRAAPVEVEVTVQISASVHGTTIHADLELTP